MTTEGAAIYSEFVELLSCFDKAVMLDLVEDALKDAHDASLLSAYAAAEGRCVFCNDELVIKLTVLC